MPGKLSAGREKQRLGAMLLLLCCPHGLGVGEHRPEELQAAPLYARCANNMMAALG